MKEYYYVLDGKEFGPLSLDEIRDLRLRKDTLVWTEGMNSWKTAIEIPELRMFLRSIPPPLPDSTFPNNRKDKSDESHNLTEYDESYQRETEVTILGLAILLVSVILNYICVLNPHFTGWYQDDLNNLFGLSTMFIRIGSVFKIVSVAKRQNRNTFVWGVFGFILPAFSLIIIGSLRKLKISEELNLMNLAERQFTESKYLETIETTKRILHINPKNDFALKLKAVATLRQKELRQ